MDVTEIDFDIKLQKVSADLITDFDLGLASFLRKPDKQGELRIRSHVRYRETYRLTNVSSFKILRPSQAKPQRALRDDMTWHRLVWSSLVWSDLG